MIFFGVGGLPYTDENGVTKRSPKHNTQRHG